MDWSWITGRYHEDIVRSHKQPLLLLLFALVITFLIIRASTRMIRAQVKWWPGNVSAGGVHLHHEFFGVLLMMTSGILSYALTDTRLVRNILAIAFGIGTGLVLDEFALLLHLQDVYWSHEGRTSIDAVIVAVVLTSMLLVRAAPFGLQDLKADEMTARWVAVAVLGLNLVLTVIIGLKGKFWFMILGTYVPLVGIIGAVRLASPRSVWARRFYSEAKMTRAEVRNAPWRRRKQHFVSLVGGKPSAADPPPAG